ncbi:hypothetical protein BGZ61DRAFT_178290 [Ilyonectria robusta]|uniref:uncharacterized protein n=1 Tax=Ilyonectria robusta TaxID=1079257 RepID=UPI001E8CE2AC|nr:uncharacterized protein BGZ61DRAFT_178290 [Ilyonectria robusta]KAH8729227.1 hypothetical protein BGZ61DRAFT_178290 [Ilyonectria robusta]
MFERGPDWLVVAHFSQTRARAASLHPLRGVSRQPQHNILQSIDASAAVPMRLWRRGRADISQCQVAKICRTRQYPHGDASLNWPHWRTEPAPAENTREHPLSCCRSYCTVPVLRVATVLVSPTFCLAVLASPSLFVASSSHHHERLAATAHMLASRDDQLSLIIVIPDGVNHRSIPQEAADALALHCRLLGLRQCVPDTPNKLTSSRHLSQIDITPSLHNLLASPPHERGN